MRVPCGWRRPIGALASLTIVASVLAIAAPPHRDAAAVPATFVPLVGATSFGAQSVYPTVVAAGDGRFHSVARSDFLGQRIIYKRSTDGGRTFSIGAMFAGQDGGATSPSIAAHGDDVAIGFIGRWCPPTPNTPCSEVPYLTTSIDGGYTWSPVRRLATHGWDIHVAVDAGRVWVAWWDAGYTTRVRGTKDGGTTFFAQSDVHGILYGLAANGGAMVAAVNNTDSGKFVPMAAVADGTTLGPWVPLSADPVEFANWLSSVAAADGRVHVLLQDPVDPGNPATRHLLVASAGRNGVFNNPVPVAPVSESAAIAATRGTVAVAVGSNGGGMAVTSVATSVDGGLSFSAPLAVSQTPGWRPAVQIGAVVPDDRPVVRFDWSVPDHYTDETGDHLPDPANPSGDPALDALRVLANKTMHVHVNGCTSLAAAGRTIAIYSWYVDGVFETSGSCEADIDVQSGHTASVRLTLEDNLGVTASLTQEVTPRDLVIVSIGDSVASGEGSPHIDASGPIPPLPGGVSEAWQDDACHRSAYAGPALAAKQLEASDPRTSVTFIQLACSGAAIVDTPDTLGVDDPHDDPDTGGILDSYRGIEPTASGSLRPAQLAQLQDLLGTRQVDALMVSTGANDARFSDVVKGCLVLIRCDGLPWLIAHTFDVRLTDLPRRYGLLSDALDSMGIAADRVMLTQYFDPTSDDLGVVEMRCTGTGLASMFDDDEANWARNHVTAALNAKGAEAAAAHGWTYVGGIADKFARHGYCASDHYLVRIGESLSTQHDPNGAFHPNRAGQEVYGDALFPALRTRLTVPPAGGGGTPGGPTTVGDLAVVTGTNDYITSVAVRSTGGLPVPGAVRQLDRLASGEGFVFPLGPPALDRNAVVGTWQETYFDTGSFYRAFVSQLGVHPNIAVQSVRVVQAPADGTKVVAGRDSVVLAIIDAAVGSDTTVNATTTVSAIDETTGAEFMLFSPVTEAITLHPGRNEVILPDGHLFQPPDAATVEASVTVDDPPGATADDASDNTAAARGAQGAVSTASRSPLLAFGRVNVGVASTNCVGVGSLANREVAFAQAAMPVASGRIDASLFCQPLAGVPQTEDGVADLLMALDEQARLAAVDAVVAVVPAGWLQAAAGGAVGVSAAGVRGIVLEAGSPDHTLAHELTHSLGIGGHTSGAIPASGVRVDLNDFREGIDWMNWRVPPKVWTGGATWDSLFGLIGSPDMAPTPLVLGAGGYWVRGTLSTPPGGPPRFADAPTLPDAAAPSRDLADLELERLTATAVDALGDPLAAPTRVGLAPTGGMYSDVTPSQPVTTSWTFAQRIVVPAGTAAIRFTLDGTVVAERPITAAPVVAVTAPTTGLTVVRGQPMTVSWTIDDPDSAQHTSSVLVSDDGGLTWRPMVSGLTGTTVTLPLPADVGGTDVRVRVAVSDGTRLGVAESVPFTAEASGGALADRLVFTDAVIPGGFDGHQLMTSNPDGTALAIIPHPTAIPSLPGQPVFVDNPIWGPGDQRVYFYSNMAGDQSPAGSYAIWSIRPDGSELRQETPSANSAFWQQALPSGSFGPNTMSPECVDVSADGRRLAVGTTVLELDPVTGGWVNPRNLLNDVGQSTALLPIIDASYPQPSDPSSFPGIRLKLSSAHCPKFTADGSSLVALVTPDYFTLDPNGGRTRIGAFDVIALFPVDGSAPRVIGPSGGMSYDPNNGQWNAVNLYTGVVPAPDGSLRVTVRQPYQGGGYEQRLARLDIGTQTLSPLSGWFHTPVQTIDLDLSPDGRLFGATAYIGCDWWIVDPNTSIQETFALPSGQCTRWHDWGRPPSGAPAEPRLTLAPGGAPPDPNGPQAWVEPTTTEPVSAEPAPGADVPVGEPPAAQAFAISIPANTTTVVPLRTIDGRPAAFDIVAVPAADQLTVGGISSVVGVGSTAPDGRVALTPAAAFAGTVTMQVRVAGTDAEPVTVTVTVLPAPKPDAVDDVLDVPAGSETVLDPAVLLANDAAAIPPSAALAATAGGLSVVSVYGAAAGVAWLDADRTLHVAPSTAGTTTFVYVVADTTGAVDSATVTLRAAAAPTDPTVPPTQPTVPPTQPTVPPTQPTVPPAQPPPPGGGTLPATGMAIGATLAIAAALLGLGLTLRRRARRGHPIG